MDNRFTAVARVGRLFGDISSGGVSLSLYTTLPEDFDPTTDALFVEIDSLPVPLYCDKFERRGVSGANVCFADFDTQRRAEELVGKELYMELADEEGDEEGEDAVSELVLQHNGDLTAKVCANAHKTSVAKRQFSQKANNHTKRYRKNYGNGNFF